MVLFTSAIKQMFLPLLVSPDNQEMTEYIAKLRAEYAPQIQNDIKANTIVKFYDLSGSNSIFSSDSV
jgi:hypothetical protein